MDRTKEEIDAIVEENIKLVKYVMYQHMSLSLSRELAKDVYQAGCMGLWNAARLWDGVSSSFSTYAYKAIRNSILRYLQRKEAHDIADSDSLDYQKEANFAPYERFAGKRDVDYFDDSTFRDCLTEKELDLYEWLINEGGTAEYVANHPDVSFQSIYNRVAWMRKKWIRMYGPVYGYNINGKKIKK